MAMATCAIRRESSQTGTSEPVNRRGPFRRRCSPERNSLEGGRVQMFQDYLLQVTLEFLHLTQEMRDAVVVGILVPRFGIDPQKNGGNLRAGIRTGHTQSTVQLGRLWRRNIEVISVWTFGQEVT